MKRFLLPILSGVAAAITIAMLGYAENMQPELVFLMAPFGATAVLVFGIPESPLARPKNVIFGHLLTAFIGVAFSQYFEISALSLAAATGLAITGMLLTKTTHPPAGANPILIMLAGESWGFLLSPVLSGTIAIVLMGIVHQKLRQRLTA
ncbi:MAG: HPP family protein [Endozoicomonas sp.]|uniref:HPP family protein n=1 Tax=Endozoicomonas sp. TaxID=1892382 RepID=UPI003D9BEA47